MLKVLFLEDDPDQILLYQKSFKLESIEMISAQNGKEAAEKLGQEKPDVLLLDILLKDENGLDVMEQMQKIGILENVPVIIFTNYEKKEIRERAHKLGAMDFLLKIEHTPEDIAKRVRWVASAHGLN